MARALDYVREGDTLVVHSMDRLARNLEDLRRLVRELTDKGVRIEFVKESLTFTGKDSAMGTLLLSMLGAVAEFERSMILERQREGIAIAKAAGKYKGRQPALTGTQAEELRQRLAAGSRSRRWPGSSASAGRPSTTTRPDRRWTKSDERR